MSLPVRTIHDDPLAARLREVFCAAVRGWLDAADLAVVAETATGTEVGR